MKIYRLERTQQLNLTLEEAWDFFSTPLNLNELTPPDMSFEILTDLVGQKMYPGMIINYKVSPIPGIKLRWTTEITHVNDLRYFVDEQRFGPYSFWHHKHMFEENDQGVFMTDIVDYGLPLGPLGSIANAVFVQNKLKHIFDYRVEMLDKKFNEK